MALEDELFEDLAFILADRLSIQDSYYLYLATKNFKKPDILKKLIENNKHLKLVYQGKSLADHANFCAKYDTLHYLIYG